MTVARHQRRRSQGFSLLELIYVITVMGVLAAVLVPVALNGLRAYEATRNQVSAMDQVRYATERMVREIREARFTTSQEVEFSTATATKLVFTRRSGSGSEVVTLENTGTDLLLGYGSLPAPGTGPQRLLASVTSLELAYLDQGQVPRTLSSPPTVAELADIYAVRIVLQVSAPGGGTLSRETVVQLKNRALI